MTPTKIILTKFLMLAVAGALGTLARFGVSTLTQKLFGNVFPWGTLTVNMLGCLFFGVVWSLTESQLVISGEIRFLVLAGFMGAFTTFSTFAFESAQMFQTQQWPSLLINLTVQNIVGIVLILLGLKLGRLIA
jgi:CrcB protein